MKRHIPLLTVMLIFSLTYTSGCRRSAAPAPGRSMDDQESASAADTPELRTSPERSSKETVILSPDGRLELRFVLIEGSPGYELWYDGVQVIRPSKLNYILGGETEPAFTDCSFGRVKMKKVDERWKPVWGQKSEIRNHCNEMSVEVKSSPGKAKNIYPGMNNEIDSKIANYRIPRKRHELKMKIYFRAYDDGAAFRYEIPEQKGFKEFEIADELTEYRFDADHNAWWIPADYNSYERLYTLSSLSTMRPCNTPVTIETLGGLYISLHEANLTDYAGMTLIPGLPEKWPDGRPITPRADRGFPGNAGTEWTSLKLDLVPWPDGVKVRGKAPLVSPWRTIQISDDAAGLIESDMILNLNEPCRIKDTSWIKPMKYVGIWWSLHIKKETWHEGPRHGATTENAKYYIDFASRHNIPGLLIEGWNTGWDQWGAQGAYDHQTPYDDFDIEEITTYAAKHGVEIIGHHETGGDVPTYEAVLEDAFKLYKKHGINSIKTGYAGGIYPRGQHHHGQWMVRHYRKVVETAAKYEITLDVHEPIADTGISRTWPNMMTREGVRGMEYNAWSDGNPPDHTTIIPFTRMLSGPADYTPGIFDVMLDDWRPDNRVHTTIAKQLALYVVLYSPLQMAADLPENYEGHPMFDFIKEVPVNWDETKVLTADIGDHVTIARRAGDSWYIGSVTDEQMRSLTVALDFLTPGVSYRTTAYSDTWRTHWEHDPYPYEINEFILDSTMTLTLKLAPGGGQALSLVPVE